MKRKYYGIKRSTVHKRVLRAMKAYYAATEVADGPSPSSSSALHSSPEPQMPEIFPEVSNEDEDEFIRRPKEPEQRLAGWPIPILQPKNDENKPGPSMHWSTPTRPTPLFTYQHPPDQPVDIWSTSINELRKDLDSLRKRVDYIAEQMLRNMEQQSALLNEILEEVRAMAVPTTASQSICRLPLCTEEAYNDFIGGLSRTPDYANEAIERLSVVGGRNEREFVRNLLTCFIGPPLCLNFCWGGSTDKRSFIGCPLYTVFTEAIRLNKSFNKCSTDVIRRTAIEWFHGARDRYGGRSKRRQVTEKLSKCPTSGPICATQSAPGDTEPPPDNTSHVVKL